MIGWIILGVLVGLITLIMLIPIGADLRYEDEVIRVSAKAAGIKFQLIPRKKGKPKEEKTKEEPKPETQPKEEKPKKQKKERSLSLNAEEIIDLLKVVLKGFGRFGRKFKVERFVLHWTAAGCDPYMVARTFSVVNAGLSQLAPICTERFHCRDSSVWTDIDFVSDRMFFEFGLTMTIRIGQIVGTGLRIGAGALMILLRSKKRVKREKKEEEQALNKWLAEHPEDAARYQAELEAQKAAEQEALQKLQEQPADTSEEPKQPELPENTDAPKTPETEEVPSLLEPEGDTAGDTAAGEAEKP